MSYVKSLLKKTLPSNNGLYTTLQNVYHFRLWKPKQISRLDNILGAFNNLKAGNVFFVQIGSNDGLNGDPIFAQVNRNKWRGILVEPIAEIFERLKFNYRNVDRNLVFENIAIANDEGGTSEFYYVNNDDNALPEWVSQLSSFDKNTILKHTEYHPEIRDRIVVKHIRKESFENMITRNHVDNIDLIHIDTEGYDFEILKQIDLEKYKPGIIIYEHKHLSEKDYRSSLNLLKEKGYSVFACNGDTLALHSNLASEISL